MKQQVYLYQVILSNSTLVYIFLIYNHSKQELDHSKKQQVYLYLVILSNSTLVYNFQIYNHSKQEMILSLKQQVYHYQVEYLYVFYVDVPFINGEYNTINAFMNVNVDDIECDESISVFNIN